MKNFKAGDMVSLKSGGPVMTVQRVIGKEEDISFQRIDDYIRMIKGFHAGDIICQWFEGNELKFAAFPATSIKLVEDKEDA